MTASLLPASPAGASCAGESQATGVLTRIARTSATLLLLFTILRLPIAAQPAEIDERVAPLWRIGSGYRTHLMINNTQAAPRTVRLDVYDADGRTIPAQGLTLAPLESREVDLGELIGRRSGFGHLTLRHSGRPLEVAAHVMIMDHHRGLTFDEHFQLRSQFLSNRLVGVSDLGVVPAESSLAVVNTTNERRRVTIKGSYGPRQGSVTLTLGSRETRLLDFAQLFPEHEAKGESLNKTTMAIEVDHDGNRGEVLVQGLLSGLPGMTANLRIVDRAKLRSSRAISPLLRLTPRQRPRLALYNLGTAELAVKPIVHYRRGKNLDRQELAAVVLLPGQVFGQDLASAIPAGGSELGLSLAHDGAPGSLVAELLLIDEVRNTVIPATPKDAEGESLVGMTFAWKLGNGASTVIALANPSLEEEINYHLVLFFDGKTYTYDGGEFLQPGEVRHIDIRRLRDESTPGQGGKLLPPDVVSGQAKVFVRNTPDRMRKIVGQAVDVGPRGPVSATLGCAVCPPDPSYVSLSPLSFTGNVGTNQQIYPWIHWSDGSSFINNNPYAINWYPGNSSVASVSSAWYNFRVQFQGPGTTTIDAQMPNECHYETTITGDVRAHITCRCGRRLWLK